MTSFRFWQLYVRVKVLSSYQLNWRPDTTYRGPIRFQIENCPTISAETEIRLHLSFGQQACHFTATAEVFVLGQHMGMCKSDIFKYKLN